VLGKILVWVIHAGAVSTVGMTPSYRELEATRSFPINALPWSRSPTRTPWIPLPTSPAKSPTCSSCATMPAKKNSNPAPSSKGCNNLVFVQPAAEAE
jgi:hypothetical protein